MHNNGEAFCNFIFEKGKIYHQQLLPADIPAMKLHHCFDNCASIAIDGKYRYVEGLARDPRTKDRWVLHAWLTDEEGIVCYDPTWRAFNKETNEPAIIPTHYIGIEMDTERVAAFMLKTSYASVFANAWRDPSMAQSVLPGMPTKKIKSEFLIEATA